MALSLVASIDMAACTETATCNGFVTETCINNILMGCENILQQLLYDCLRGNMTLDVCLAHGTVDLNHFAPFGTATLDS